MAEDSSLSSSPAGANGYQCWISEDPSSKEILRIAERVKDTSSILLIQGESGTGKDLLANLIHYGSARRGEPFLKIDCSSIPAELMESELFGYEKGAFTGAASRKLGKLEFAREGTLVLDGIAALELDTQAKLLRVIEEKVFERLGGNETITLKARIIALSNDDLDEAVRLGSFREDLFFRINVIPILLLPLRSREKDISPLAKHFFTSAKFKYGKPLLQVSPEVFDYLQTYPFPGNVRELRNLVERLVMVTDSPKITADHLPASMREILKRGEGLCTLPEKLTLQDLEKRYIAEILEYTRGKKGCAARILGISRKTLLEKRKRYGLMG
jgi:two-component system response regulator AtoC